MKVVRACRVFHKCPAGNAGISASSGPGLPSLYGREGRALHQNSLERTAYPAPGVSSCSDLGGKTPASALRDAMNNRVTRCNESLLLRADTSVCLQK